MLPARHRLRRSADFSVAVRGIRSGSRLLVVHAVASDASADGDAGARHTDAPAALPVRVGFVVSKAVGNAVVRNRTKRRLRALMGPRVAMLPAGLDLVIRANPAAATATSAQLERSLDSALRSALSRVEASSGSAGPAGSRP